MMSLLVNEKGKDLETASKQTKLPTKKIQKFLSAALSRTGYGFIQGFCLIFHV